MAIFSASTVTALAPHLVDLVRGVLPLFTADRKGNAPHEQDSKILHVQIGELQEAATTQGKAIQELAERTEQTIRGLELQLQRQKRISYAAVALSLLALAVAILLR